MNKKEIKRRCLVCGMPLKITVDEKKNYKNGHYFGKLDVPIKGTGRYKRVGMTKLGRKTYPVVKWTGKEKQVEYWECNKCYRKD